MLIFNFINLTNHVIISIFKNLYIIDYLFHYNIYYYIYDYLI